MNYYHKPNTHMYRCLTTSRGNKYKLGGKIDAYIYENGNTVGVSEIKNRSRRIYGYDEMPIYDVDQLSVYAILTKLDKFVICETLKGKNYITEYSKEELNNRWIEIKPLLDEWVDRCYNIYDKIVNDGSEMYLNLIRNGLEKNVFPMIIEIPTLF